MLNTPKYKFRSFSEKISNHNLSFTGIITFTIFMINQFPFHLTKIYTSGTNQNKGEYKNVI